MEYNITIIIDIRLASLPFFCSIDPLRRTQMIKSRLDNKVVTIEIEGEFLADELVAETDKWLKDHRDEYIGYLVDIRNMTRQTAVEQKKAEEAAKKRNSGKPRAVLGKDLATAVLVNIYMRFTNAQGIRYFTNEQDAKTWLMNYKQNA